MATQNLVDQIRRQRQKQLRELKAHLRNLSFRIEKTRSLITLILKRKVNTMPGTEDAQRLNASFDSGLQAYKDADNLLNQVAGTWPGAGF